MGQPCVNCQVAVGIKRGCARLRCREVVRNELLERLREQSVLSPEVTDRLRDALVLSCGEGLIYVKDSRDKPDTQDTNCDDRDEDN
jgi:hypothetical protein